MSSLDFKHDQTNNKVHNYNRRTKLHSIIFSGHKFYFGAPRATCDFAEDVWWKNTKTATGL